MIVQSSSISKFVRCLLVVAGLGLAGPLLAGCDLAKNDLKMDRAANMEVQDFRDGLAQRPLPSGDEAKDGGGDQGIPSLQSYVAGPSPNLRPMPLVSISVNQTVPLKDALFELADQVGYDLALDPRITGSIIFTARDQPFDLVVQHIADIANLRCKFEGNRLRVELDSPYNKTYKIDYITYVRKNKSNISNDVSVMTGSGTSTGSGFQSSSESEADFWGELSTNLQQIMGTSTTGAAMKTSFDPQITAATQNPYSSVQPVVSTDAEGATKVEVQPPSATLQVSSLPTDASASGTPSSSSSSQKKSGDFAVNKQAGMITVFGTERQHKQVAAYLTELKRSVTAQVLIEAKVMEVGLTDEFATGINWSELNAINGKLNLSFSGSSALARPQFSPTDAAANFKIAYTGGDVRSVIDAVSRFGTVRALASPRLTVLNNQSAVLDVANNQVYFEVKVTTSQAQTTSQTNVSSTIHNVPEGVLINVQPSIDLNNRTVSLAVRPTITKIIKFVEDPAVTFAVAQAGISTPITSQVPVVNVQEMDSVVKLHSGQAILMGGLMQDRMDSEQNGIPILSEMPILGSLFRSQGDKVTKTELVVFLKATIIDNGNIDNTDRDIYKKFSTDRRPFDL